VDRRRISSDAKWEAAAGYSRAVVAGDRVFVSGTTSVMPEGAEPPSDAHAQAMRCFEIIFAALEEAGARPEDVVRTRIFLVHEEDFDDVIRAHGEIFGEIRPASTAVVVSALIERWARVEIEADAVLDPDGGADQPPSLRA
jgi:enamine deaminase RidA (YjgF/YER057c/UK114 family)